jgi:hypothetical protein
MKENKMFIIGSAVFALIMAITMITAEPRSCNSYMFGYEDQEFDISDTAYNQAFTINIMTKEDYHETK